MIKAVIFFCWQDNGLKLAGPLESRLSEEQKLAYHVNRALVLLLLNRQEACTEALNEMAKAHPQSHLLVLLRAAVLVKQNKVR